MPCSRCCSGSSRSRSQFSSWPTSPTAAWPSSFGPSHESLDTNERKVMSSEVVTRQRNSRPSLMSRELKRRRRLSLRELMQVYHYLALGVLSLVVLVLWIPFEVVLVHSTLVSALV